MINSIKKRRIVSSVRWLSYCIFCVVLMNLSACNLKTSKHPNESASNNNSGLGHGGNDGPGKSGPKPPPPKKKSDEEQSERDDGHSTKEETREDKNSANNFGYKKTKKLRDEVDSLDFEDNEDKEENLSEKNNPPIFDFVEDTKKSDTPTDKTENLTFEQVPLNKPIDLSKEITNTIKDLKKDTANSNTVKPSAIAQKKQNMANKYNPTINAKQGTDNVKKAAMEQVLEDTKAARESGAVQTKTANYQKNLNRYTELAKQYNPTDVAPAYERVKVSLQTMQAIGVNFIGQESRNSTSFSNEQQKIDEEFNSVKKGFSGILSLSSKEKLMKEAIDNLQNTDAEKLKFLATQNYFFTDILDNTPDIANKLSPDQLQAISTAVISNNSELRENAIITMQLLIRRLVIHSDTEASVADSAVDKLDALVVIGKDNAQLEDRIREKARALRNIAGQNKDQNLWNKADAVVQKLDYLAKERIKDLVNKGPTKEQIDAAKDLAINFVSMGDGDFANEIIKSLKNRNENDAITTFSLLLGSKDERPIIIDLISNKIATLLGLLTLNNENRMRDDDVLIENLLRNIPATSDSFFLAMNTVLNSLDSINGYPKKESDYGKFITLMNTFAGPLNSRIKNYDYQIGNAFDLEKKIKLVEAFEKLKERQKQWTRYKNNEINELTFKKDTEDDVTPKGGFGLYSTKNDTAWKNIQWIDNHVPAYNAVKEDFKLPEKHDKLEPFKSLAKDIVIQLPFMAHPKPYEEKLQQLIKRHDVNSPLMEFIYELKTEQHIAVLMDVMPVDKKALTELMKLLNVGDNASLSTFKRVQNLTRLVLFYSSFEQSDNRPQAQLKLLMEDPKFWEVLGAQSEAAAEGLQLPAYKKFALMLNENQASSQLKETAASALTRIISKMEINGTNALDLKDKLENLALAAKGYLELQKSIASKLPALQQYAPKGTSMEKLKNVLGLK